MTLPIDTDDRADLLVGYAIGDLTPAEARALETEMERDPALAAEVRELRECFESIGQAATTPPPAALRARVLAAASPARATERGRAPARRLRWIRRVAIAAVAASLVVAVGIDDLRLRRELSLLRELTETLHAPNVVVSFQLRGTDRAARAFGSAILDLDAKKAALVVRGLPALPSGEHYLLWAKVGDAMVPCGRFQADAGERVVRQLAIPVQDYTEPVSELVVTVETDPTVVAPTGPRVMLSS